MWFFTEIICLKCQNLQKYRNWWKPKSFLLQVGSPLQSRCPIIDNIFLSYTLVEHNPLKFLKEGTGTSSLAGIGDETWNLAQNNTKGLNRVPNLILDQNSRSNEFGPEFVPVDTIFCARKFCLFKSFRFSHSQPSKLAYMHLSMNALH